MAENKPFAFQSGDKFWVKRATVVEKGKSGPKGGAPCAFASPEVLLKACYEYFEYEHKRTWSKPEAIKGGEFAGQLVNVTVKTPFAIQGLCIFIGVNTKYLSHFEDKIKADKKRIEGKGAAEITEDDKYLLEVNDGFSNVITHVKDIINKQKIEGALVGAFHATLASQLAGLATKTETEIAGKGGGAIAHNVAFRVEMIDTGAGVSKSEAEILNEVNKELGV